MRSSLSVTLALLLAVPFTSFAADNKEKDPDAIGDRDVSGKVNFYSLEKEIALGKQLAQQVEHQSKIINDPVVSEYVNRIGQNLVRNSDAKVPFTIKVVEDPTVNAFALPGGFFFVDSGLILKADTEAELAGVMAHEIAHVAARHGTRQATRGEIAQLSMIPLYIIGGPVAYGLYEASGLLIPITFLKFSRGFEAEADYLGVQYMYKTGYDPTAFVDFFEKIQSMEKRKPGTMSKMFATHPPTDDRIVKAQKEIAAVLKAKPEYVVTTSEFEDVKGRLAMLENQRRPDKATSADPNKPTLRRNPNSNAPIEDETDPSKKSKGDDDDRPKLKRRPSDTGDSGDSTDTSSAPAPTSN
ncbi:MAG TPA: M48 family metallopeptidase [Bryobacteraceae bacterium]|nr:M48 family metallopeptidase [Bryobacteraceae bacterium]